MKKKKQKVATEFVTVKRIDNSRLVRNVEPVRLHNLYRTAGLGAIVAACFMLYIYQHFRCIDLSFQLEDMKAEQTKAGSLNSELRLEIESLRDPRRIELISRQKLGLTDPLPTQIQDYEAPVGAEVAAARYVRPNRVP